MNGLDLEQLPLEIQYLTIETTHQDLPMMDMMDPEGGVQAEEEAVRVAAAQVPGAVRAVLGVTAAVVALIAAGPGAVQGARVVLEVIALVVALIGPGAMQGA